MDPSPQIYMNFGYDDVNVQLVVGRPYDDIVTLFRPNRAPLADAGADQTLVDSDNNGAEDVVLDGSGSSDSDGTIVSYVQSEEGSQIATGVNPTVSFAVDVHTVTMEVTDNDGVTDTDSVIITVEEAPNAASLADAGPDQIVMSQATVSLDGSASDDPDGNLPLAYLWEQTGGTAVTLSGSDTASPTFTAPQVITQTAVLTFTLVVSDSLGMPSQPDEVVISVEPYSALLPLILKLKYGEIWASPDLAGVLGLLPGHFG